MTGKRIRKLTAVWFFAGFLLTAGLNAANVPAQETVQSGADSGDSDVYLPENTWSEENTEARDGGQSGTDESDTDPNSNGTGTNDDNGTNPNGDITDNSGVDANGEFHLDADFINSYDQQQSSDMIFFGDSRVVGMSFYAGGYHYVGKVSMGYDWMSGEGSTYLLDMMEDFPQADIVFCFGVNDLGNVDAYINWYRQFMDDHPDRRCWFLAVTPVNEGIAGANGYSVKNSSIADFNTKLQAAFPDQYLDAYSYLMEYGANTGDGVHYDGITYAGIEDFAWRAISAKLDEENQR